MIPEITIERHLRVIREGHDEKDDQKIMNELSKIGVGTREFDELCKLYLRAEELAHQTSVIYSQAKTNERKYMTELSKAESIKFRELHEDALENLQYTRTIILDRLAIDDIVTDTVYGVDYMIHKEKIDGFTFLKVSRYE